MSDPCGPLGGVMFSEMRPSRPRAVLALALMFLAAPLGIGAQQAARMPRVGILGIGPTPSRQELEKSVAANPFWLSMKELGWVDGKNMLVERRFGESADQL